MMLFDSSDSSDSKMILSNEIVEKFAVTLPNNG